MIVERHEIRMCRHENLRCRDVRQGGPGWYIYHRRNGLFTDRVFAGLAAVFAIGLLFEHLVFQSVERLTIRRWGMQR